MPEKPPKLRSQIYIYFSYIDPQARGTKLLFQIIKAMISQYQTLKVVCNVFHCLEQFLPAQPHWGFFEVSGYLLQIFL